MSEGCLLNLENAVKNISSFEISAKYLRDAMNDLDELYGRHNEEDKLEIIFNNFCVENKCFVKHKNIYDVLVVGGLLVKPRQCLHD